MRLSRPTETFESKVSNKIDEAASEGERMLARVWKIIAANGVAAILFGFVLALWPDIGLTTIVAVVAVYALVRGVLSGLAAFCWPLRGTERAWLMLEAVVGTAIGVALLVWNDISAQALLYVVAAWAIAIGVLMLAAAIQLPLSGGRRLLLALNGLIAGAFGAVMFIEPDAGAVAIVALIAAFTIVIGIMQVGFALELRNVAAEFRQRFPRSNTTRPWRTPDVHARTSRAHASVDVRSTWQTNSKSTRVMMVAPRIAGDAPSSPRSLPALPRRRSRLVTRLPNCRRRRLRGDHPDATRPASTSERA